MAGKSTLTAEELAQRIALFRENQHLTFTEACRVVGIPPPTARYQLEYVVPTYAEKYPQYDWTQPVFSLGGSKNSPPRISVIGDTSVERLITSASDKILDDNKKLREELAAARATLASYDREYADAKWIKERLYNLSEQTVVQPDWLIKPKKNIKSPGIPCMMWSDLHWSEVVDPMQVNGVNSYDLKIANQRMKALVERTIILLRQYMVSPNYDGVVLCLGGDLLSGDIHEELSVSNAAPIMASVVDLWGALEWAIKTLADEFGRLSVFCVTGNHGRNTKKVQSKGRAFTSFDWLVYVHLQHAFKNDKRVSIMAPSSPDILFSVYGHRYLLTHGDQFRGGDGMIGMLGPVTRGQKKKLARNAEIGQEFDTMVIGHWHQWTPGDRIIVNGSLVGYSEYSMSNNFAYEPPRQALWITHPKHGITFHCPVYVEDDVRRGESGASWVSWLEAA